MATVKELRSQLAHSERQRLAAEKKALMAERKSKAAEKKMKAAENQIADFKKKGARTTALDMSPHSDVVVLHCRVSMKGADERVSKKGAFCIAGYR